MNLLLLSNSTSTAATTWDTPWTPVTGFPALEGRQLAFVPRTRSPTTTPTPAKVRSALARHAGIDVRGCPRESGDPSAPARRGADAVFVGGGNSFRLLSTLYRTGLREALIKAVGDEAALHGRQRRHHMAAPSLRTTNDMPIVEPPSFEALGLVPFKINPHYLDPDPASTHKGRDARGAADGVPGGRTTCPCSGCGRAPGCGSGATGRDQGRTGRPALPAGLGSPA
ncbi:Type 1 glutamine amidotransferase-like domain-containing protein [Streptomyces thinghirensis]|nr:Type 1 glutamine amidotransferase-like domain-containing protein [Streptomyces thinghirensis]